MLLYLGLTALTVLLAYAVNNQSISDTNRITRQQVCNRIFIISIFTLLFIVSAGRYYVGNDYGEYVGTFAKIHMSRKVSSELGFNTVVRAIQILCGYEQFIPVFAVFSFATVAFFLKAIYDQAEWFPYSFFLFMASGYYLSSLNTVRYYFALAIAMFAAKYIIQRDYTRFLIWILVAAMFHKTVLLVIPVYWFASKKWKKIEIAFLLVLCTSLLFFKDFYRSIIFKIYPYYENSVFDTGNTSYSNIIKGLCILVFALLFYKQAIFHNKKNEFYFNLNIGALLVYLFASFIPEVSRIGYYMNAFQVFLIPNILIRIPDKKQRIFFTSAITIAYFLYFAIFMYRASGVELRIIPYATWIMR